MRAPIAYIGPLLFILLLLFGACAPLKDGNIRQQIISSHCNQQNIYNYSEADLPKPLFSMAVDQRLSQALGESNLNMANAIGILDDLSRYVQLQENLDSSDLPTRIRLLELKQGIEHRINMASLEVSAVASEMDCEEERTSQVANYLRGRENELESKLTVSAIVLGALGAIATGGLLHNEKATNAVGVSFGIAEASLGLLMLFNNKKIDFYHQRNALREIWEGKSVSSNFPAFVWYYLNYTDPNTEVPSIREEIIDKWKNFGQVLEAADEQGDLVVPIYFGAGGRYSTEQLVNRADMYDQLESYITLMKQDLKALSLAIERMERSKE
ncbi:MAG TPA: hypothetical protein VK014_16695 [Cyclobacteriaceae bacterium]|nr:hypothetical protein [Cyclobacteriaceae bacterium]